MKPKRLTAVSFLAIKMKQNSWAHVRTTAYTPQLFLKVSPVFPALTCSCLEVLYLVINGVKWLVKCFSLL